MREIFELVNQMSPYILLGFFLAGVMHAFVPHNLYRKYLGGGSLRSVVNATLLGIPLPLCSCGVIPTAMSLRKEGASKGATTAFLISTPQTGIDSIIATYSLMGLPFALLRPLAAFATAIAGGFLVSKLTHEKSESPATQSELLAEEEKKSFAQRIAIALRYAFVEMMQDIGKWLVAGLVIAGLITVFVPNSFFEIFAHSSLLSMLLVLTLAIPMYLCATGSIPIAVALMLKGLSPGTALVLLMAGPAVNAASMLVISKVMGRRTLAIYLGSIVAGAVSFGLVIDHLLPREWFLKPLATIHSHCHTDTNYFNIACSVVLLALLTNAFVQRYRHKGECNCGHDGESCTSCDASCVFEVEGMACNHCKANVEKALKGIEGVESAEADLLTGRTTVTGSFSKEEAVKAVEALGFSIREAE